MPLILADVNGSPNLGVYCFASDIIAVVPKGLPQRKVQGFSKCLGVETFSASLGGSNLLGALVAANSCGMILPHFTRADEVKELSSTGLETKVLRTKYTAFGNLILANDKGALIDPRLPSEIAKQVSETLGVEVVRGKICGLPYVGSLAVATNKGALTHPSTTAKEREALTEVLKVPVEVGTVNGGIPYIRAGLLANSRGAIAGSLTRGPELLAISQIMCI